MPRSGSADGRALTFLSTMPEAYGRLFDEGAVRDHAEIVARRGSALVHIEVWRRFADGVDVLCVVAPDRPGLLSAVAASFAKQDLTIQSAQIYTRNVSTHEAEAVDFFWVRSRHRPVGVSDATLSEITRVLEERLLESAAGH
jgi:[protein-PII] uridylyltransferase